MSSRLEAFQCTNQPWDLIAEGLWFRVLQNFLSCWEKCVIYLFEILSSTRTTLQLCDVWNWNWCLVRWLYFDWNFDSITNISWRFDCIAIDRDNKNFRNSWIQIHIKVCKPIPKWFKLTRDPRDQVGEAPIKVQTWARICWFNIKDSCVWSRKKIETFLNPYPSILPWLDLPIVPITDIKIAQFVLLRWFKIGKQRQIDIKIAEPLHQNQTISTITINSQGVRNKFLKNRNRRFVSNLWAEMRQIFRKSQ